MKRAAATLLTVAAGGVTALALAGCSSSAPPATFDITYTLPGDSETSTTVTVEDLRCTETSDRRIISSGVRVADDLPAFTATGPRESGDRYTTALHVTDDLWFMTSEPFEVTEGTFRYDGVTGGVGHETAAGRYPLQSVAEATISGVVKCED